MGGGWGCVYDSHFLFPLPISPKASCDFLADYHHLDSARHVFISGSGDKGTMIP